MFTWNERELNDEQNVAIRTDGHVYLEACPGSGKTRALTYKLAYELSRLKSKKSFIVAITYTNRAADEIHERVEKLGVPTDNLWIGTIHSFCLEWIFKPYWVYHPKLRNGYRVMSLQDTEDILTKLCASYLRPKITHYDCGYYFEAKGYRLAGIKESKRAAVEEILSKYFRILAETNQIDFEFLLFHSYELIRDNPIIAFRLSQLFPFLLLDEYQDTKDIQYQILAAILKASKENTTVFMVGDPNQAIYESLGGYPIEISHFNKMADITLQHRKLKRNYRSSSAIIEYYDNFKIHSFTEINAAADHKDYDSVISHNKTIDSKQVATEIARLIKLNVEQFQIALHEICVLAPQWVHLGPMTRELVSLLTAYSFNGPGLVPFARDHENFWFKLSRIVLTTASPVMYIRRNRWAGETLTDLEHAGVDVSHLSNQKLLKICNSIHLTETDGLAYLKLFFDELLRTLRSSMEHFPILAEHHRCFFKSSEDRVARLAKEGTNFISEIGAFRRVFEERQGITVSTIHGIKGDEYDCVIAYALLEGFVPHFAAPNQRDSASKLLYVISSRARRNLHLISERGRKNKFEKEYVTTQLLAEYGYSYRSI